MTLTVTILGHELLRISTDPPDDGPGDVTTSPVGFAPRVDLPT
jgi:hypothetical protein